MANPLMFIGVSLLFIAIAYKVVTPKFEPLETSHNNTGEKDV